MLVKHPNAFVTLHHRKGHLEASIKKHEKTIAVCEAAGYDVILIETGWRWAKRSDCEGNGGFLYAPCPLQRLEMNCKE